MSFQHIPSEIGAVEAEEVGVEHLLRDIHDTSISTVASNVNAKILSLKSLVAHLKEMHAYLNNVCEGKLPANQKIISQLQDIFNLLPNLNVDELVRSFAVKTNDMMLVIYLSSLIRSIIALHNLINNKVRYLIVHSAVSHCPPSSHYGRLSTVRSKESRQRTKRLQRARRWARKRQKRRTRARARARTSSIAMTLSIFNSLTSSHISLCFQSLQEARVFVI
jgi:ribosome-binding protein aMBF1 (putative translation factor)